MTHPTRAWLLPAPDGVGVWKAENNGSAEMVGAVEFVPVQQVIDVCQRDAEMIARYDARLAEVQAG